MRTYKEIVKNYILIYYYISYICNIKNFTQNVNQIEKYRKNNIC